MERLTTDKDVSEMNMTELAFNSCYAKDGFVRCRDFDIDIDARDLARLLIKHYTGEDAPTDDEEFDEYMLDDLQYSVFSTSGFIALFYRNLWAMAELRERLKKYEDALGALSEIVSEKENYFDLISELAKILVVECKLEVTEKMPLAKARLLTYESCEEWERYKQDKENGLLVRLPRRVGTPVYAVYKKSQNEIEYDIDCFSFDIDYIEEIGKTVFLTRAEAETKLKEMEGV